MRDDNAKYTYYRIDFKDWSEEFDYTITETIEDVLGYLQLADTDLDNPERETRVIVSGVAMTPIEYRKWLDDHEQ